MGTTAPAARVRWWLLLAAAALMTPVAWAMVSMASPTSDPTAFMNVRLGMSSSQIRARVEAPGQWSSTMGEDGLLLLHWEGQGDVESARFELHEGILVAIRADYRAPRTEELTIAPEAVRQVKTSPAGNGELTILARGCPVHEDEVEALIDAR
ncbi:MAG: hypothetical protein AAGE52_15610 [Myxococcota bacterium]